MSDGSVLSQHEIDSRLQGGASEPDADPLLATGSSLVLPKTVKRYDFRRPDKFSKEQLRSLQAMHETYARLASTLLSNQMRTTVDVPSRPSSRACTRSTWDRWPRQPS